MNPNRTTGYPKWYYGTDITEYWEYVSEPHRKHERWRFDLLVETSQVQYERQKWQEFYEQLAKEHFNKSNHVLRNVYDYHAGYECIECFKRTQDCSVSFIESGTSDRNVENPCPKLVVDYNPYGRYGWYARAVFALGNPVKIITTFYNDNAVW